ncbi:hypothetical protein O1611_g296 [Lasiodiplodia mahajangana]|uniref:Uncharacterized protein n=1 Tax=Lasiodiplodia mahajangana TaxID=1108764 RepID=A0ACC2K1J6_9PEZI|nr:hypothetical protein O1611_g296 [Lasiodiplodia mahajangana]
MYQKRCTHTSTTGDPVSPTPSPRQHEEQRQPPSAAPLLQNNVAVVDEVGSESLETERTSQSPACPSQSGYLRFIGDLSAEASFLEKGGNESLPRLANVGVWLGHRDEDARSEGPPRGAQDITYIGLNSTGVSGLYSRDEYQSIMPPDHEFGIILKVYYAKIDPIIPIMHDEKLDQHRPAELSALKQCICLLAAPDPSLRPFLKLRHCESVLSPIEFRAQIAAALKRALDFDLIRDKVVVLQVCIAMAFHVSKLSCSEISAYYCAQAVQYAQTLGLHLGWPGNGTISANKSRRIFWCVWVLDRLNAATNGRPVLIHGRDMDQSVLDSISEQAPAFRLSIRISRLLDDTISQYRPHATSESSNTDENCESFEHLVQETESSEVGNAMLGTFWSFTSNTRTSALKFALSNRLKASLELYYLAVIILRSRPKKCGRQNDRIPSSSIQCFSAMNIVSIVSNEFKHSVSYWPALPYAVSLATSVAYQNLRNSSLSFRRKRAYALFYSSCDVLDGLGGAFISAQTMARLAKDTVREVERVAAGRSKTRSQRKSNEPVPGNSSRATTHHAHRAFNEPHSAPSLGGDDAPRAQAQDIWHGQSLVSDQPWEAPMDLDPNLFNDVSGVSGIFSDFDPSFDLNGVDTVFSVNLDPTLPLVLEDWMTHGPFGGQPTH